MKVNLIEDKSFLIQEEKTNVKENFSQEEISQDPRATKRMSNSTKRKAKNDALSQENVKTILDSQTTTAFEHGRGSGSIEEDDEKYPDWVKHLSQDPKLLAKQERELIEQDYTFKKLIGDEEIQVFNLVMRGWVEGIVIAEYEVLTQSKKIMVTLKSAMNDPSNYFGIEISWKHSRN